MSFNFRKARRKDKEEKTSAEERKPYLEDALIQGRFCEVDLKKLVTIPQGLDYNEWLATNSAFSCFALILFTCILLWIHFTVGNKMTGECVWS